MESYSTWFAPIYSLLSTIQSMLMKTSVKICLDSIQTDKFFNLFETGHIVGSFIRILNNKKNICSVYESMQQMNPHSKCCSVNLISSAFYRFLLIVQVYLLLLSGTDATTKSFKEHIYNTCYISESEAKELV